MSDQYKFFTICPAVHGTLHINNKLLHCLQVRNTEEHKRRLSRLLAGERRKRRKLEALGIEFDFPGYSQLVSTSGLHKPATHTVFVGSESDNE